MLSLRGMIGLLASGLLTSSILAADLEFTPCRDETLAPGCPGSIQWDGGAATTAWATGLNWSTNALPGSTDDVCIPDLGAGVEVVHSTGTTAVNSIAGTGGLQVSGGILTMAVDSPGLAQLVLSGGTFGGSGSLLVSASFSWSAGIMTGSATTSVPGGAVTGSSLKDLLGGRTLQTAGTIVWTGTGGMRFGGGGNVQNAGIWDAQGNAAVVNAGGAGAFNNLAGGTFRKSGGGGTTTIDVPLTNAGTVAVESGTLSLDEGGSATGAFTGSAGTTLRFGGGAHVLGTTSSLSADAVTLTSGSVTVDGTYSASATTVSGGALTFDPVGTVSGIGALSVSGAGNLTLNSGEAIAPPTLAVSGGTLGGSDSLTVPGTFTWTAGTMTGNGTTMALAGIAISGTSTKDLTGSRTLSTSGTTTWAGTGTVRLGSGGNIQNAGTWDAQGNAAISNFGAAGAFANLAGGTFRKSAGGGTTTIDVPLTNAGTVAVESGTLSLDGGGSATGAFTGSAGTTLRFGGGAHVLGTTSSLSADAITLTSGSVAVDGTYSASATTVSGGALTFDPVGTVSGIGALSVSGAGNLTLNSGEAIAPPTLSVSGGTLGGTDGVTVPGTFTWTAGTMTGNGTTAALAGIAISGSSTKDLSGNRTLSTSGTTTWAGTGTVRFGSGGNVQNAGIWDAQGNAAISNFGAGGPFANLAGGTFRKSAGGGTTTLDVPLTNAGTVAVVSGTLSLDGGGSATGGFTGSMGTTLRFGGGSHVLGTTSSLSADAITLTSGSLTVDGTYSASATTVSGGALTFDPVATVSGIGALAVSGAGTVTLNSGEAMAPPTLAVSGGTLGGTDGVTVPGTFTWTAGTMAGNGTTAALAGIAISGTSTKDLMGSRTLSTSGSTTWAGTGTVRLGSGGNIQNAGTWDVQGDAALSNFGAAGAFANQSGGTFRKSAGGGTTTVGVPFTNAGTVRASSGTLQFTSSFIQSAGTTLLDGGTLSATVPLSLQGGSLSGTGTVAASVTSTGGTVAPGQSAGILLLGGTYTQGAAATLAVEVGGLAAGVEHDRLDVNGAVSLAGTLQVSLIAGFVPADGNTFTVMTFPSHTGTFDTTSVPPLPDGLDWLVHVNPASIVLEVYADLDHDGVRNTIDCAPSDPTAWGVPVEVAGFAIAPDKQTVSWTSQAASAGSGTVYDAVRGLTTQLPVGGAGESCLLAGSGSNAMMDASVPAVGSFYYLVRARNACGVSTYGTGAAGTPRATATCP
ncbi:MAG TPA: hypothetical protein VFV75_15390 [Candidatus Polarisedimenticolaceae bacterium]|nr:hypothetical protein [Candidatus Polarisedimenticolaceae bacterium]